MSKVVRILAWCLALALAAEPIIFTIAGSPTRVGDLFIWWSYLPYGRDVSFLAVAILAIGLIDGLECLATVLPHNLQLNKTGFAISLIILVVLVPQMLTFSVWSANLANSAKSKSIFALGMVGSASIVAFVSRLTLLFGALE